MTKGERIRRARERLRPRMSQERLGELVGVSKQAVSGWERDEGRPDIDNLPKLVRALNVSYKYLLDGDSPNELYMTIETLPERQKKAVLDFLEAMTGKQAG